MSLTLGDSCLLPLLSGVLARFSASGVPSTAFVDVLVFDSLTFDDFAISEAPKLVVFGLTGFRLNRFLGGSFATESSDMVIGTIPDKEFLLKLAVILLILFLIIAISCEKANGRGADCWAGVDGWVGLEADWWAGLGEGLSEVLGLLELGLSEVGLGDGTELADESVFLDEVGFSEVSGFLGLGELEPLGGVSVLRDLKCFVLVFRGLARTEGFFFRATWTKTRH